MKKVVRKLFVNFEKEEKWINEMAAKGLHLVDYSLARYVFEKGKPGEYIYRLELLDHLPSSAEGQVYIESMEEYGVECVATYYSWAFFRKRATEGSFDIYTDYDSRIKHYKSVITLIGIVAVVNLIIAFMNTNLGLNAENESGKISLYLSLINWFVVIVLTPVLISFMISMFKLKKAKKLYE
ncbi:DUF2812 domain-containing protein [Desulfuribacillus alkaliarsenatis]|uniref:DUF2812 domain-containing protein n=1 Tax=Desulfuribacillus alkaliarsenatis TaxID=766136 RepID=A0A1E5G191_9FIRM|nr:DUF2812 domain-containing protein [Desulfuribacillus alkaliarsenatis]OEF96678.1 hypothetical protein BHF68_06265 [Desulfuribacillus alkaliarsenatis]